MRSKKKCQKIHTARRIQQRFGDRINQKELIKIISSNRAEFIERQSNRVTVWKVKHCGLSLICVYDKIRKSLATVVTEEMWNQRHS